MFCWIRVLPLLQFGSLAFSSVRHLQQQGQGGRHSLMMSSITTSSLGMTRTDLVNDDDALRLYESLRGLNNSDPVIGSAVHTALDVLDDAVRLYGPEQVYSSYNGGKDAVVIMHLLRASVAKYSSDKGEAHRPMLVYFAVSDEFPEVLEFIAESEDQYGVEVRRSNSSIVKGLAEIIESKALAGSSSHLAFVLGTRRGDPNCGDQSFFSPSSKWMPPFMRVNPILHWTYGQVWHFLRSNGLAYCKLYDLGYTSLGKRADTRPNPALKKNKFSMGTAGQEGDEYFPAHMLADFALERSGRGAAKDPSAVPPMSADGRMHVESAGMIIIGDEILSGFTTESNLMITSTALGGVGVPLKRVAVVSDDEDEIVKEVRRMSQEYDIVITSGGIGPTHDDVTIKAVAAAFGQSITANPVMVEHLNRAHAATGSRDPIRASFLRLAELPSRSTLRFPPPQHGNNAARILWPILQCNNVFVLPGVPEFFSDKITAIAQHFIHPKQAFFSRRVLLALEEKDIVATLDASVAAHPHVKFGSYPFLNKADFKTIVTVQGADEAIVGAAVTHLIAGLPEKAVVGVEDTVASW